MNVLDTIELRKGQFTKTDWTVYGVMSEDWVRVFRNSSNALANKYGLSQASVVRFCKKLGFDGYADFRMALYGALQTGAESEMRSSKAECYKRLIDLIAAEDADGTYESLIQRLSDAKITVSSGVHRSSLPAQLLMFEMRLLDHLSYFVPQDQLGTFTTGLTPSDVFVMFSEAGDTVRTSMEQFSMLPDESRPHAVLVCMSAKHPLRKYFDEVIVLPSSINQNLPVRVDPSTIFSFFTDLISGRVAERTSAERS